jgi:hypothetical protein
MSFSKKSTLLVKLGTHLLLLFRETYAKEKNIRFIRSKIQITPVTQHMIMMIIVLMMKMMMTTTADDDSVQFFIISVLHQHPDGPS